MSSNRIERQMFAHGGLVLLGNTAELVANGFAVEFIEDTVISELETELITEQGLALDEVTWSAGRILFVQFSSITLTSGSIIVYLREA